MAESATNGSLSFDSIPTCIEAFRGGAMLLVLDSPSRENEGDLIIPASATTPSTMSFLIRHTSGYLCAAMPEPHASALGIRPMVSETDNHDPNGTRYGISVDATKRWGVTTGISARDRCATARVLGRAIASRGKTSLGSAEDEDLRQRDPDKLLATPNVRSGLTKETTNFMTDPHADLRQPGHVLPLLAREGGVRTRRGHTEAGVDLCRLAGYDPPVAVIGEVVEETPDEPHSMSSTDGRPGYKATGMLRAPGCIEFGRKWGIKVCTISALVEYLEGQENSGKRM